MEPTGWQGQKAALALAGLLLLGMGGVAIFTSSDRARRPEIEIVSEPTAAGDKPGVEIHDGRIPVGPLGTLSGRPFYAAGAVEKRKDAQMLDAGSDDSGALVLYRDEAGPDPAARFVKTSPDHYLRVGDAPLPAAGSPPAP